LDDIPTRTALGGGRLFSGGPAFPEDPFIDITGGGEGYDATAAQGYLFECHACRGKLHGAHVADSRSGEQIVIIRADTEVDYGTVMAAMDQLRTAGIEDIGLITDPEQTNSAQGAQ